MATRTLTAKELTLAEYMLRNGSPRAAECLPQLADAQATDWRCPCGCASLNFKIGDLPKAPPGVNVLGDFIFGSTDDLAGIFIYQSGGTLSEIEVYGLGGDAPHELPDPSQLRSLEN